MCTFYTHKGAFRGMQIIVILRLITGISFYTLTTLPANLLLHVGGVVSAHSVKLLDKINNPDEPETRDAWWLEVRNEVRSHAKAMGCNAVNWICGVDQHLVNLWKYVVGVQ